MNFEKELEIRKERILSNLSGERTYTEAVFEDIKHINEYGQEF